MRPALNTIPGFLQVGETGEIARLSVEKRAAAPPASDEMFADIVGVLIKNELKNL